MTNVRPAGGIWEARQTLLPVGTQRMHTAPDRQTDKYPFIAPASSPARRVPHLKL